MTNSRFSFFFLHVLFQIPLSNLKMSSKMTSGGANPGLLSYSSTRRYISHFQTVKDWAWKDKKRAVITHYFKQRFKVKNKEGMNTLTLDTLVPGCSWATNGNPPALKLFEQDPPPPS